MIIEIDLIILDNIEKQLQIYFNELNLHIKFNAGIEFYKKEIVNFIIPYFDKNNIKYKILSKDEIDGLIRKIRIYDNNDNTSDNKSVEYIEKQIENVELNNKIYNPRDYNVKMK
jgi:hypothetical protein